MGHKADVVILGAGMVGVSAALHLQARGRDVVIVDKHGAPAAETSYGNSGIIEGSVIGPHLFPRDLKLLARYGMNALPEANYHLSALATLAPWLYAYFRNSAPERAAVAAKALVPLVKLAIPEHKKLIEESGAQSLVTPKGWIKLYRSPARWEKALKDAETARSLGLRAEELSPAAFLEREPSMSTSLSGAMHMHDAWSVQDPGGLGEAYNKLFLSRGGRLLAGDARSLSQAGQGWTVQTAEGLIEARDVVLAMGPWSDDVFRPLGYTMPLGVKRGYHLHYAPKGNAGLNHPIYDADGGFVLAPMRRGIRLTTGAEFALRDAAPTPVQIDKTSAIARSIFPLGEPVEPKPWLGRRPCLPDMLPVIGKAGKHKGLWFDFGHQHLGFTLGPISGRLIADMMTGEKPVLDPAPYRAERFD